MNPNTDLNSIYPSPTPTQPAAGPLPPAQPAPSPTLPAQPTPTPVQPFTPTPITDNAEKKRTKIITIIGIIVAVLAVIGVVAAIVVAKGSNSISCSQTTTEDNITIYTEHTIHFVLYRANTAETYQKISFPYKIDQRYADEYRAAINRESSDQFNSVDISVDNKDLIVKATSSVNWLTHYGKSKDEIVSNFKSDGYTCKDL